MSCGQLGACTAVSCRSLPERCLRCCVRLVRRCIRHWVQVEGRLSFGIILVCELVDIICSLRHRSSV